MEKTHRNAEPANNVNNHHDDTPPPTTTIMITITITIIISKQGTRMKATGPRTRVSWKAGVESIESVWANSS